MPAHLDEPIAGAPLDPLGFFVRGWLWLEGAHTQIATVEVFCGDVLLGETRTLYTRPDVSAALGLPSGIATGFELYAHHASFAPGEPFELQLRARLRDGSHTPVLHRAIAQTIGRDYRTNHFGVLLDQRTTAVQRHDNLFATGPSLARGQFPTQRSIFNHFR